MAKFKFLGNDQTYTLVERPLFPETEWVEKQASCDLSDMTSQQRDRAAYLLSMRRAGTMLTWQDFDGYSPADFVAVPDDEDPTPTGAEAGTDPGASGSARSGGSSRSKSSRSTRATSSG